MKYKVIKDTREQLGWEFTPSEHCEGTQVATLRTGDYSLYGYETKFIIERKGTTGEFARNIIDKRFSYELDRLEGYDFPFVILEFNIEQIMGFPVNSGIPPKEWPKLKINKYFFLKKFLEFQTKYKTKFILAGGYGKDIASSLFKRVIEHYGVSEKSRAKT